MSFLLIVVLFSLLSHWSAGEEWGSSGTMAHCWPGSTHHGPHFDSSQATSSPDKIVFSKTNTNQNLTLWWFSQFNLISSCCTESNLTYLDSSNQLQNYSCANKASVSIKAVDLLKTKLSCVLLHSFRWSAWENISSSAESIFVANLIIFLKMFCTNFVHCLQSNVDFANHVYSHLKMQGWFWGI